MSTDGTLPVAIRDVQRDLAAAIELLNDLPIVSRDRELVVATIRILHDQLLERYNHEAALLRHQPLRAHVQAALDTMVEAWRRVERSNAFLAEPLPAD